MKRKEAIDRIRAALRMKSETSWSVRGDIGSAYGWIIVDALPRNLINGRMSNDDAKALANLFGLETNIHGHHLLISPEEREEYVQRAESAEPCELVE
jgi:hypothetical protein